MGIGYGVSRIMPRPKSDLKRTNCHHFPLQLARLDELARLRKMTRNEIIRQAVDDHLERLKKCLKP
jgi:hypothetical protein